MSTPPELMVTREPEGWLIYACAHPGCRWEREAIEGMNSERIEAEGRTHVKSHDAPDRADTSPGEP